MGPCQESVLTPSVAKQSETCVMCYRHLDDSVSKDWVNANIVRVTASVAKYFKFTF